MSDATIDVQFKPGTPPDAPVYPGFRPYPGLRPGSERDGGMLIERDVAVPLRDGVEIYADVFRPEGAAELPALLAWSPYGKHVMITYDFFPGCGVRDEDTSSYTLFEGPDPVVWTGFGYAVVHVDPRGTWRSGGEARYWGAEEGRDAHDVIEWIAAQSWSGGKVGMCGVSYLTAIQWFAAAERPPHLAAIQPAHGFNDLYRDLFFHGGIRETRFTPHLGRQVSFSSTRVEDLDAMADRHPLDDAYWASKAAALEQVEVPAYVVAGWRMQGIHTRGTIEGYRRIGSTRKWLEIHAQKEWEAFYTEEAVRRQRAFFDRFLKGEPSEVDAWPAVRVEVRSDRDTWEVREADAWPLPGTRYERLHLDVSQGALVREAPAHSAEVAYDACEGRAVLDRRFDEPLELIGHMTLKLWVEARGADDADLFAVVEKLDAAGEVVPMGWNNADEGPIAFGWLRVSHRELDPERSEPWRPWHRHAREQPLSPGEVVPLELELMPSATAFAAGEGLRVRVQGTDAYVYEPIASLRHEATRNAGQHVLHAGGAYDAHLLVPVAPPRADAG